MTRWVAAAVMGVLVLGPGALLRAQSGKAYRARLSPVPIDLASVPTITGSGSLSAVLAGSTLTLTGTFAGLQSPATVVRLHRGRKGIRGPAIVDLKASSATSGDISGKVELNPSQIEDLNREWIYVQLHSEKAPEGNLWGWLLPEEGRR
jgi:hypothetical protein